MEKPSGCSADLLRCGRCFSGRENLYRVQYLPESLPAGCWYQLPDPKDFHQARAHARRVRQGELEEMSAVAEIVDEKEYVGLLANTLPHVIHTEEENERCIAALEALDS